MVGDNVEVPLDSLERDEQYDFLHQFSGNQSDTVFFDNVEDDNPFITNNAEINDCPYNNVRIDCQYYTETSFLDRFSTCNKFCLLNWNIWGLASKWDALNDFLSELRSKTFLFDIIAFQEIFQLVRPEVYKIPGYQNIIFRCRSDNARGGGVGIFV